MDSYIYFPTIQTTVKKIDPSIQKNIDIIKFTIGCSSDDAFKYLDYRGQINTDCMGNFKEFLPKIVYPERSEQDYKKHKATYK